MKTINTEYVMHFAEQQKRFLESCGISSGVTYKITENSVIFTFYLSDFSVFNLIHTRIQYDYSISPLSPELISIEIPITDNLKVKLIDDFFEDTKVG